MGKGRLEAFFDAVVAVAITIMVLEMKAPHGDEPAELLGMLPIFLSYVLSFIYIGIYWVNHHHFYHLVHKISGGLLWSNLGLLFCLSLVPFTTAWMGENHFSTWPVALYGVNLLANSIAWWIMAQTTISLHGPDSEIARALGRDVKGKLSSVLYVAGIALAFVSPWISCALYALVAFIWLVPDKRIERMLGRNSD